MRSERNRLRVTDPLKRKRLPGLFYFLFILLFSTVLSGCAGSISGRISAPDPVKTGYLQAGAAKIDITPPPGYPMGGHSVAGKISRGYWLRLYARSIFLVDPEGNKLALVSTDLWSMPAGLSDRVAQLVSENDPDCNPGREGLVIAATHTHQSPGNFASSLFYNSFASPQSGYDPNLFEFIAGRIAESIHHACVDRKPARIYYDNLKIVEEPFARNRSFDAFSMDLKDAQSLIEKNKNAGLQIGPISTEYPNRESYLAVDPTLRILRIRNTKELKDIAIAAFVSVHNTSLSHDAEVYNSDLFGYAALVLEKGILKEKEHANPQAFPEYPVVAIFNGAEGDVSPAWNAQDRRDTVRLGNRLAVDIDKLAQRAARQDHLVDPASIRYSFKEFTLPGSCCEPYKGHCAAAQPLFGVGALGGAEDGRTIYYYCGWREGIAAEKAEGLQGKKRPAFDAPEIIFPCSQMIRLLPTQLINLIVHAPKYAPVGVYRIGPVILATLPGEFTTMLGEKIDRSLADAVKVDAANVILVGLANEYMSYFTTGEEYDEQSYEGASMIYGQWAGEVLGCALLDLAATLDRDPQRLSYPLEFSYDPGPVRRFGITNIKNAFDSKELGLDAVVLDNNGIPDLNRHASYCWSEGITEGIRHQANRPDEATRVIPRVKLIAPDNSIIGEDDQGDIATVVVRHDDRTACWCSFALDLKDGDFKFVVSKTDGTEKESPVCRIRDNRAESRCEYRETVKQCSE